jgi:hypothetical protein
MARLASECNGVLKRLRFLLVGVNAGQGIVWASQARNAQKDWH